MKKEEKKSGNEQSMLSKILLALRAFGKKSKKTKIKK